MDGPAPATMPLQFYEKVQFKTRAEDMLRGRKKGSYMTWSTGATSYNLTYVCSSGEVVTNPVGREAGGAGTFYFSKGLPESRVPFRTLEDLISSRPYLVPDDADAEDAQRQAEEESAEESAVVDEIMQDPEFGRLLPRGTSSSSSSSSSSSAIALAGSAQLRHRKSASSAHGAAHLPESLRPAPPAPLVIPLNDDDAEQYDLNDTAIDEERFVRGVRPTLPDSLLLPLLARTAGAGAAVTLTLLGLRYLLQAPARAVLHAAGRAAEEAAVAATVALIARLEASPARADAAFCAQAAQDWVTETTSGPAARTIQAAISSPANAWVLHLMRAQVLAAAVMGIACIGLFFVHTGKPFVRLTNGSEGAGSAVGGSRRSSSSSSSSGLTDAQYEARRMEEMQAESLEAERALSRPNQLRWGLAFFALLAGTLVAAHGASSLLNAAALAPSALSRAAQALSLRWPASHMPPDTATRSGVLVSSQGTTSLDIAIRWGVWRAAATFGKVPLPCLGAMAGAVEPVVDGVGMAWVPLLGGGASVVGGGAGGGGVGGWDPLAHTWLAGWLRMGSAPGGLLGLTLPTDAGLAKAVVLVFSAFMVAVIVLLFGVDSYHTECRPWLLRRGARAKKAAAEARQQAVARAAEAQRADSAAR